MLIIKPNTIYNPTRKPNKITKYNALNTTLNLKTNFVIEKYKLIVIEKKENI